MAFADPLCRRVIRLAETPPDGSCPSPGRRTAAVRDRFGLAFIAAAALASAITSCRPATDIRPEDVRSYTAPRAAFAAPSAPWRESSSAGAGVERTAPAIAYEIPDGWTDSGPSGMRLATLRPAGDSGSEITVIPASGTLESNAARWQEQLTPGGSAEAVARAIDEADKAMVNGVEATILLLKDGAAEKPQAILAAMIPLDASRALFVKFKGPESEALALREPFTSFVRSLRWK